MILDNNKDHFVSNFNQLIESVTGQSLARDHQKQVGEKAIYEGADS